MIKIRGVFQWPPKFVGFSILIPLWGLGGLSFQSFRSTNNLQDFVGNCSLACLVVSQFQLISQFGRVVCCFASPVRYARVCIAVIRAPCSEANESLTPLYNCVFNYFGIKVNTISSLEYFIPYKIRLLKQSPIRGTKGFLFFPLLPVASNL